MGKRGRPSRHPTDAEKQKVEELVGDKSPIADIAAILGRSIPNLRKYFARELFSGKKSKAQAKKPPFKISQVMRDKVVRYIGCKMKPVDVGRVLGITQEQLEEFFPEEIATGQARYRAKVIDHLDLQMEDGTVGATNKLEALSAILDAETPNPAQQPGYVGKKAAASATANAAAASGGKFAPPSGPKLVVDNKK